MPRNPSRVIRSATCAIIISPSLWSAVPSCPLRCYWVYRVSSFKHRSRLFCLGAFTPDLSQTSPRRQLISTVYISKPLTVLILRTEWTPHFPRTRRNGRMAVYILYVQTPLAACHLLTGIHVLRTSWTRTQRPQAVANILRVRPPPSRRLDVKSFNVSQTDPALMFRCARSTFKSCLLEVFVHLLVHRSGIKPPGENEMVPEWTGLT